MRRNFVLLMVLMICSMSLFFACKGPYDDLKISLSYNDIITLYVPTAAETANSQLTITATASGVKKKKNVQTEFSLESGNCVDIDIEEEARNVTKATIKARTAGTSYVRIVAEGNVYKKLKVVVLNRIENIGFSKDQSAIGEGKTLNLNDMLSYNVGTGGTDQTGVKFQLQKSDLTYTDILPEAVSEYISIDDGVLSVKKGVSDAVDSFEDKSIFWAKLYGKTDITTDYASGAFVDYYCLKIRAVSTVNGNVVSNDLLVPILRLVEEENIKILSNSDNEDETTFNLDGNGIVLSTRDYSGIAKNFATTRDITIQVSNDPTENAKYSVTASYVSGSDAVASISAFGENEHKFRIKGLERANCRIKFTIDYIGFEGLFTIEKYLDVSVKELPSKIYVNNEEITVNSESETNLPNYYIYDQYNDKSESALGTLFKVSGVPSENDLTYRIELLDAAASVYAGYTSVMNGSNQIQFGDSVRNGSNLYLKHNIPDAQNGLLNNPIKAKVTFSFNLNPGAQSDNYKQYEEVRYVNLIYKKGVSSLNMSAENLVQAGGNSKTIVDLSAYQVDVSNQDEFISDFVVDNDYLLDATNPNRIIVKDGDKYLFTIERTSTGKINIIPNNEGNYGECNLTIKTMNGLVETTKIKVFVPLIFADNSEVAGYLKLDCENNEGIFDAKTVSMFNASSPLATLEAETLTSLTLKTNLDQPIKLSLYNFFMGATEYIQTKYNDIKYVQARVQNQTYARIEKDEENDCFLLYTNGVVNGTGIDIEFTIQGYVVNNNQVEEVRKTQTLTLYLYHELKSDDIALNKTSVRLYDYASVGYYSSDWKSQLQIIFNRELSNFGNVSTIFGLVNKSFDGISASSILAIDNTGAISVNSNGNTNIQDLLKNGIDIEVEAKTTQYTKDSIIKKCVVHIEYAEMLTDVIMRSGVNIDGVYMDARVLTANSYKIVSFETRPTTAYNGKIFAVVEGNGIVQIAPSSLDSNGALLGNSFHIQPVLKDGKVQAGETIIRLYAQDAYTSETGHGKPLASFRVYIADGSQQYPFEVKTESDLLDIQKDINANKEYYYALTRDINVVSFAGFTGDFKGHINGIYEYQIDGNVITRNGAISNVRILKTTETGNVAIFETLSGSIENLTINNARIEVSSAQTTAVNAAILVAVNNGTINNVSVDGEIVISGGKDGAAIKEFGGSANVGGLVAVNAGDINTQDNSSSKANIAILVYSKNGQIVYAGGIAGTNSSNIGLADAIRVEEESTVEHVTSNFSVTANIDVRNADNNSAIGGAVGYSTGNINNVESNPFLRGNSNIGGLVGIISNAEINDSTVYFIDNLKTEENAVAIMGYNNLGGLAGMAQGTTIQYSYVRGFFGKTEITDTYLGNIVLQDGLEKPHVGGLIGLVNNQGKTTIDKAYFQGDINVLSTTAYSGGLVGKVEGDRKNTLQIGNTYVLGLHKRADAIYVSGTGSKYGEFVSEQPLEQTLTKPVVLYNSSETYDDIALTVGSDKKTTVTGFSVSQGNNLPATAAILFRRTINVTFTNGVASISVPESTGEYVSLITSKLAFLEDGEYVETLDGTYVDGSSVNIYYMNGNEVDTTFSETMSVTVEFAREFDKKADGNPITLTNTSSSFVLDLSEAGDFDSAALSTVDLVASEINLYGDVIINSSYIKTNGNTLKYTNYNNDNAYVGSSYTSENMGFSWQEYMDGESLRNYNGSVWAVDSRLNDGMPLLYRHYPTSDNMLMFESVPSAIDTKIKDTPEVIGGQSHVKVDGKAVLFYNKLNGTDETVTDEVNKYYIMKDDSEKGYTFASYTVASSGVLLEGIQLKDEVSIVSSDESVLYVGRDNDDSWYVVVKGQGTARLTITSVFQPNVYAIIEVKTLPGVSNIALSDRKDDKELKDNNEVFVNENKTLGFDIENKFEVNGVSREFQANDDIGYLIKVSGSSKVYINGELRTTDTFYSIKDTGFSLKTTAMGDFSITVVPYLIAGENYTLKGGYAKIPDGCIVLGNMVKTYNFAVKQRAKNVNFSGQTEISFLTNSTASMTVQYETYDFDDGGHKDSLVLEIWQGDVLVGLYEYGTKHLTWLKEGLQTEIEKASPLRELLIMNAEEEVATKTGDVYVVTRTFRFAFDENKYRENTYKRVEKGNKYELGNMSFTIKATPYSNSIYLDGQAKTSADIIKARENAQEDISKLDLSVETRKISEITKDFYPFGETDIQEEPQNRISPGRNGLLKIGLEPIINDSDFITVSTTVEGVQFRQVLASVAGVGGMNLVRGYVDLPIQRVPIENGVSLRPASYFVSSENKTVLTENDLDDIHYYGIYYLYIYVSKEFAGSELPLTITAYKFGDGGQEIAVKTEQMTLDVEPLPEIKATIDGHTSVDVAVGMKKEIQIEVKHAEIENVEFLLDEESTLGSNYDLIILDSTDTYTRDSVTKYKISPSEKPNIVQFKDGKWTLSVPKKLMDLDGAEVNANGKTMYLKARVSKNVNGLEEDAVAVLELKIRLYIVDGLILNSPAASGNTLEVKNGTITNIGMQTTIQYGEITDEIIKAKAALDAELSAQFTDATESGGNYYNSASTKYPDIQNNWFYYSTDPTTGKQVLTSLRQSQSSIFNGCFALTSNLTFKKRGNDLRWSHSWAISAYNLTDGQTIVGRLNYVYDKEGKPQISTSIREQSTELLLEVNVVVKDNSTYDHPNPVKTIEDLRSMQSGAHYILMNDLTLNNWEPLTNGDIASLDGNGYVLKLSGISVDKTNTSNLTAGIFESISSNTVLKNITIDVGNMMMTQSQVLRIMNGMASGAFIDLSGITNVTFGILAGRNSGSITNCKVINSRYDTDANNLFIYTTQKNIGTVTTAATVGTLVGQNTGTISYSYVGSNFNDIGTTVGARNGSVFGSEITSNYEFRLVAGKTVGGLAGSNSGIITNSYVYRMGAYNLCETSADSVTGGFVAINENNAEIISCFVEGSNKNTQEGNYHRVSDSGDFGIVYLESKGVIGGFVGNNEGSIRDAYSAVKVKTNSAQTAGFVYNNANGTISSAYSTTVPLGDGSKGTRPINSEAFGVFVGKTGTEINNENGSITNCYYLIVGGSGGEVEDLNDPAKAIIVDEGNVGKEQKDGFIYPGTFIGFSLTEKGQENAIWTMGKNGPEILTATKEEILSHRKSEQDGSITGITDVITYLENNYSDFSYRDANKVVDVATYLNTKILEKLANNKISEFYTDGTMEIRRTARSLQEGFFSYLKTVKTATSDGNAYTNITGGTLQAVINAFNEANFILLPNGVKIAKEDGKQFLISQTSSSAEQDQIVNYFSGDSNFMDPETTAKVYNYQYVLNELGTERNPLLVSTAEEFITFIINNSRKEEIRTISSGGVTTKEIAPVFGGQADSIRYIKLIKPIDFNTANLNGLPINEYFVDGYRITDVIFAGILEGNNLSMSGLDLQLAGEESAEYGLFRRVGISNEHETTRGSGQVSDASIFNLTVNVNTVNASSAERVGFLAGSVYNAAIINVTVQGEDNNASIRGNNVVGGIAGYIGEDSSLVNIQVRNVLIHSNTTISGETESDVIVGSDVKTHIGKLFTDAGETYQISYAGAVAGILNCTNNDTERTDADMTDEKEIAKYATDGDNKIMNISVSGKIEITADNVGGVFGYIGKNTSVKLTDFILSDVDSQRLQARNYVGAIVAENHGLLQRVTVQSEAQKLTTDQEVYSNKDTMLFVPNTTGTNKQYGTVAVGGIAGYSENGIIVNSFSRANVVHHLAKIAGGLVGIAEGYNYLGHVYTTGAVDAGSVLSASGSYENSRGIIGGLVGFAITSSRGKLNLDYAFALNNWELDNFVKDKITANIEQVADATAEVMMPEVGNQKPTTKKVEGGKEVYYIAPKIYIGSVIGAVTNKTNSSNSDKWTIDLLDGTAIVSGTWNNEGKLINDSLINAIRRNGIISGSRAGTEAESKDEMNTTIFSTDFYGKKGNDEPSNSQISYYYFDPVFVDPNGLKESQDSIEHLLGTSGQDDGKIHINLFRMWEYNEDFIDSQGASKSPENPLDSVSKVWKLNKTMPEYITGLETNFEEWTGDVNKINHNTKGKLFVVSAKDELGEGETADITINENNSEFIVNNPFEGSLVGEQNKNGRKPIVDVNISFEKTYGLFKMLKGARISNIDFVINVENDIKMVTDSVQTAIGMLIGEMDSSTLDNVTITINMKDRTSTKTFYVGDIVSSFGLAVGSASLSTLNNVTLTIANASLNINAANQNLGMLVGRMTKTSVSNVEVSGIASVTTSENKNVETLNFGGIAGSAEASNLKDVKYASDITLTNIATGSANVGGIIGYSSQTNITNAKYVGAISSGEKLTYSAKIGGIAGTYLDGIMANASVNEDGGKAINITTNKNIDLGAYIGYGKGVTVDVNSITENKNDITVTQEGATVTNVGGIIGQTQGTNSLSKVINSGKISVTVQDGSTTNVGGIAGAFSGSISKAYQIEDINFNGVGKYSVGGLVGSIAKGSSINTFIVYKDIKLGSVVTLANEQYIGGVFGSQSEPGNLIIANGISYARVFNYDVNDLKNDQSRVNAIGFIKGSIDPQNVYIIKEFIPYGYTGKNFVKTSSNTVLRYKDIEALKNKQITDFTNGDYPYITELGNRNDAISSAGDKLNPKEITPSPTGEVNFSRELNIEGGLNATYFVLTKNCNLTATISGTTNKLFLTAKDNVIVNASTELFDELDGTISGINVKTAHTSGAALVGIIKNTGVVMDCTVFGQVTGVSGDIQGLATTNNGALLGSGSSVYYQSKTGTDNYNISALVSTNAGIIKDCYSTSNVAFGDATFYPFVVTNNVKITDSYYAGTVNCKIEKAGGTGIFNNCYYDNEGISETINGIIGRATEAFYSNAENGRVVLSDGWMFYSNTELTVNFGYPVLRDGYKIKTLAAVDGNRAFSTIYDQSQSGNIVPIFHKGQMYNIRNNSAGNYSYVLLNDINMGGGSRKLGLGTFGLGRVVYGNGKTISNWAINDNNYHGIFETLNGEVYDLTLDAISITTTQESNVGILAGVSTGKIVNVTVKGLTVTANQAENVGGLVGSSSGEMNVTIEGNITINNTLHNNAGGLVGELKNRLTVQVTGTPTISVQGSNYVGGLVGRVNSNSNNYGITIQNGGTINVVIVGSGYVGGLIGENGGSNTTAMNIQNSSNFTVTGSVSKLAGNDVNYVGGIVGYTTVALANFTNQAKVDGNNYVGGIAGYISGEISNSISNATITGSTYVGGIAGGTTSAITLPTTKDTMNVSVTGAQYVGGVAGQSVAITGNNWTISGTIKATGSGDTYVGGVAGCATDKISNFTNNATVSGANYVGGIVGQTTANIENSISSATITGNVYVGGIAGGTTSAITLPTTKNTMNVSVTGAQYVGGVAGQSVAITGNGWTISGTVKATGSGDTYVGGVVGQAIGKISDFTNKADVTGKSYVGGVVGYSTFDISNLNNSGTVTGTGKVVGGIAGQVNGTKEIVSCVNSGAVTGRQHVGGLIGWRGFDLTINGGGNSGVITLLSDAAYTSSVYAGGLVGYCKSNITLSGSPYSNGNVVTDMAVKNDTGKDGTTSWDGKSLASLFGQFGKDKNKFKNDGFNKTYGKDTTYSGYKVHLGLVCGSANKVNGSASTSGTIKMTTGEKIFLDKYSVLRYYATKRSKGKAGYDGNVECKTYTVYYDSSLQNGKSISGKDGDDVVTKKRQYANNGVNKKLLANYTVYYSQLQ